MDERATTNPVIPGRRAAANPESITSDGAYGFRVPTCGRPRNDWRGNARMAGFPDKNVIAELTAWAGETRTWADDER